MKEHILEILDFELIWLGNLLENAHPDDLNRKATLTAEIKAIKRIINKIKQL